MRKGYLESLETEFARDEVAVVGRPQLARGRFVSGELARYRPEDLARKVEAPCVAEPDPPAPTLSMAELECRIREAEERAAAQAAVQVSRATRDELLGQREAAEAQAMQEAIRQLATFQDSFDQAITGLRARARTLILEVVRAVIPRAVERAPLADVEGLLQDLVPRLDAEPQLHLELVPEALEHGRELFARIAADSRYRGDIEVTTATDLAAGEARLRWQQGSAERRLGEITKAAIEIAERWLDEVEREAGDEMGVRGKTPDAKDEM